MLSQNQIDQYLNHIGFPQHLHPDDPLQLLAELQKRQLEIVPFENFALHYSRTKVLSLDLDDLFKKVVVRGRGGYCMENNNFFGAVLRGLGFESTYVVGRVKCPGKKGAWLGWSHLVNLVKINNVRYLVDVGHGSACPTRPVMLGGGVTEGIAPQQLKLEFTKLPQHSDASQRVWVYSHRRDKGDAWNEGYCFTETECFPSDFETFNLYPMTSPNSIFTQAVLAQRFLMSEKSDELIGSVALYGNRIKMSVRGNEQVIQTFQTEQERIEAIARWFGIRLSIEEQEAIKGHVGELKP
ncbi:hypothetical protein B0T10DRAFT_520734 [Thelonectria olida]|uniref:Arylamine N-acetyltransferase n=1 Tax=Thelonectria olida TaxID=1576542 RepID=A0A9P8VVC0_9HYPO|nr:hypothetical protein B0T10DRAFT_520734 [Thelonectria olida]